MARAYRRIRAGSVSFLPWVCRGRAKERTRSRGRRVIPLPLQDVRALGLGELAPALGAEVVTGVQIDSRRIEPGDLFVGLRGSRVDASRAGITLSTNTTRFAKPYVNAGGR